MIRWLGAACALGLFVSSASAEVVTRPVEYKHGATALEGVLALDTSVSGRRPGILIAHEGAGSGPLARQRALQFARMGHVAFALDLYGKGTTPGDAREAAALLGLNTKDRGLVRARTAAAYHLLAKQPQVDSKRIGAVGYGVGGTALLELARTGVDLEGVAVVHGDLTTPPPADGKKIVASLFVVVGSDDPQIPWSQIAAFEEEMRSGGVDWQVLRLGGAVHDFTNPAAGRQLQSGSAYDAGADRRAHAAIKSFLAEAFATPTPPAVVKSPVTVKPSPVAGRGVPEKVLSVLRYVDQHGAPMAGYEGGRTFLNVEKVLPQADGSGRRLRYREWDVLPHRPGVNRGPERLVTGSDGSAYYTDDHYRTFKKIR